MIISANKWEHDVQGYLNICNITDSTPRKQIRDFAAGVNDLGLWDSMVCWPLRSTQNVGTGTTAYSLGGLGTFNGTLVNGPSWGVDGVSFSSASSQRMTTGLVATLLSSGAIYSATSNAAFQLILSSRADNPYSGGIGLSANGRGASTGASPAAFDVGEAALYGAYLFLQGTHVSPSSSTGADATVRTNKNARIVSTSSHTAGAQSTALFVAAEGPSGTNRHFNGTLSAAYVSTARLSASQQESLYDLYKQTLGTGLGLP